MNVMMIMDLNALVVEKSGLRFSAHKNDNIRMHNITNYIIQCKYDYDE